MNPQAGVKSSFRLLAPGDFPGAGSEVTLETGKGRVLRLRRGDLVELLFDGAGYAAAEVVAVPRGGVRARVEGAPRPGVPLAPVVVASAAPKGARLDWMIEKCAEGRAEEIRIVSFERSVREEPNLERLARIAEAAALQAGLGAVPRVSQPPAVSSGLGSVDGFAARLLLFPGAARLGPARGRTIVVIGPEGGFTEGEGETFARDGFVACGLGPSTFRTETAAVLAAGILGG